MMDYSGVKTIFFDYDGTLHNSMGIYGIAFRKAYDWLVAKKLAAPKSWADEEIAKWLGYNPKEMWENFMPGLSEDHRNEASALIGSEMNTRILAGQATLYDGALETLSHLKEKGYRLVFISNCRTQYMKNHIEAFQLDAYFEAFFCSEAFDFIPKHEILKGVKERFSEKMVIVGDRFQDMEAGLKNEIYTIGCNYGFGNEMELSVADFRIDDIKMLKAIF